MIWSTSTLSWHEERKSCGEAVAGEVHVTDVKTSGGFFSVPQHVVQNLQHVHFKMST